MSTLLQVPTERPIPKRRFRRPALLGMIALVLGILSLSGGVIHWLWGPFTPRPTFSEQLADNVASLSDTVVSTFTGQVHTKQPSVDTNDADLLLKRSVVLLSLAGIVMAILGYVRRENKRVVRSALLISGSAFAMYYLLFPLVVLTVAGMVMLCALAF
jgi:hypothetical protein